MDEVITYYERGKFDLCYKKLKDLSDEIDDITQGIVVENAINVCQSLACKIELSSSNICNSSEENICKQFNNTLTKVKSLRTTNAAVHLELELVIFYNMLWWAVLSNSYQNEAELEKYLHAINECFLRVFHIIGSDSPLTRSNSDSKIEVLLTVYRLLNNIEKATYEVYALIIEITALVLLFIIKSDDMEDSLLCDIYTRVTENILSEMKQYLQGNKAILAEMKKECISEYYFKFNLDSVNSTLSKINTNTAIDVVGLLGCLMAIKQQNYQKSLNYLRLINNNETIWFYIGAFSSFCLKNLDLSLGFLLRLNSLPTSYKLKCRYHILYGRLCQLKGDHSEALINFTKAKECDQNILLSYYYIAQEYSALGMKDMVVDSLQSLVQVARKQSNIINECNMYLKIDEILLNLLHPANEITKSEFLYAAAYACGFNEQYEEAVNLYQEVTSEDHMKRLVKLKEIKGERIINLPSCLTILHEAATMNLFNGNLFQAEQLCKEAINKYSDIDSCKYKSGESKEILPTKDTDWIRNVIDNELEMGAILNPEKCFSTSPFFQDKSEEKPIFFETQFHCFEEDIIGLFLLSEIQKTVQNEPSDEYRSILTKILVAFSKYISASQKREKEGILIDKTERATLVLVKALAAKVCLNIAICQVKLKMNSEIEKMFKRALSCNNGDKDVLFHYTIYLISIKNLNDANKLWKTFYNSDSTITLEQCHSLALKYLLKTNIAKKELDKVESDLSNVIC